MTEDFDLDVEIIDVYELNDQLRVKVKHCYGEDNFGLSIKSKVLNPFTDQPKWMGQVYKLLNKKYGPKTKSPIQTENKYKGQILSINDLKVGKVSGFEIRLRTTLEFTKEQAKEIMNVYSDPMQLRIDIMSNKDIGIEEPMKSKLIKYYGGTGLGFDSDEREEIKEMKKNGQLDELGNDITPKVSKSNK